MRTDGYTRARPLIEWRAVFGGTILGLAFFALISSLWVALAYGSDIAIVADNLPWVIAGTAIAAMLMGGYLAGLLSGVRGGAAGFFNGSTVWGLIMLVGLAVGVPTVARIFNVEPAIAADDGVISTTAAWAGFFALAVGWFAAALGGIIGGSSPRDTTNEIVLDETGVPAHEHRGGAVVAMMTAQPPVSARTATEPAVATTPAPDQRRAM